MIFLVLLIGLLNVGLGYFLAVRLGYGPPRLTLAWRAIAFDPRWPIFVPPGPMPPPSADAALTAPTAADVLQQDDAPLGEAKTEPAAMPADADTPAGNDAPALPDADLPESWDLDE